MGYNHGVVLGTEKVHGDEPPGSGFNVCLIAEGYTRYEQDKFVADAQHFVDTFLATPPFDKGKLPLNFYRIHVASMDSGASDPWCSPYCYGSGARPRTFLDASFCSMGLQRLMAINKPLALWLLDQSLENWKHGLVMVNTQELGGLGTKDVSVTTVHCGGDWAKTGIHELGHALFDLEDEYAYWQGCDIDEPSQYRYVGPEVTGANITIETDPALLKWKVIANQIPTTANSDCATCDPAPDPTGGLVGLFEGAHYHHCGVYRPTHDCRMRNLDADFCPVCAAHIEATLIWASNVPDLTVAPRGHDEHPRQSPLWLSPGVRWDPGQDEVTVTVSNQGTGDSHDFNVMLTRFDARTLTDTAGTAAVPIDAPQVGAAIPGAHDPNAIPDAEFTFVFDPFAGGGNGNGVRTFYQLTAHIESDETPSGRSTATSTYMLLRADQLPGFSFMVENPSANAVLNARLELIPGHGFLGWKLAGSGNFNPGGFPLASNELLEVAMSIEPPPGAQAPGAGATLELSLILDGETVGGCTILLI